MYGYTVILVINISYCWYFQDNARKFTRSTDTDNTKDISIYTGASREIVYRIDVMCKEEGIGNRNRPTMIQLQFLFLVIQNTVLCFSLLRVVSCRTDKKCIK